MRVRERDPFQARPAVCHEASHAAMALVLGLKVSEIRCDRPDVGVSGWTVTPPDGRRFDHRDLLVALAGGLIDGGAGATRLVRWPPSWPPLPDDGDGGRVHRIYRALGLDAATYDGIVALAEDMVATVEFQRLYRALVSALRRSEHLNAADIERIAGPHLKETENA